MQSGTEQGGAASAGLIGKHLLFPAIALLLVAGGAAALMGRADVANPLWFVGTLAALISASLEMAARMRRGEFGLDVIAALAMAGALLLEEHLAGKPISVPLTNPIGCNVKWEGKDAHWIPNDACDLVFS